jgi:phospholipase/lecithinase/hemolysin
MSPISAETVLPKSASFAAAASPFSTIYAFGDSLSDVGNLSTLTLGIIPQPPYAEGVFTNGLLWVQDLAAMYRLPLPQTYFDGGNDYAIAGAETGATQVHDQNPADLDTQIGVFRASNDSADPNALYTLSIGSNDCFDIVTEFYRNPDNALAAIKQAVANETGFIQSLADEGAQNFLVMNVPDIGKIPAELAGGPFNSMIASAVAGTYDYYLNVSLTDLIVNQGLNIHVLDAFSLVDQIVADPATYGITNTTDPLWSGNFTDSDSGTLAATGTAAEGYLFFDAQHPTASGHSLLAAIGFDALQPPPVG